MSAIARFLVEFDPSPSASPWPVPGTALPGPPRDGDPTGDENAFGGDPDDAGLDPDDTGLDPDDTGLDPDDTLELASSDPEPADTSIADAVAAAEAGFSERIALLEEEHARARAEDRARWAASEGPALAEAFRKAAAAIEDHLGDAVAAVLGPLMAEVLKGAALRELRQTIAALTASGSTARIEVAGAEDLVQAVRTALEAAGDDTSGMVFVPSEETEVTVTADNSTIRTRLAEWAVRFEDNLRSHA